MCQVNNIAIIKLDHGLGELGLVDVDNPAAASVRKHHSVILIGRSYTIQEGHDDLWVVLLEAVILEGLYNLESTLGCSIASCGGHRRWPL